MKREEVIAKLKDIDEEGNTEMGHILADDILCDFLKHLGYKDIVDEYNKIGNWYA